MRLGTYFRKELLDKLNIKTFPEDIVLDVGCFDGYWLSTQKAKEKYGLDLDIVKKYKDVNYVYGSGLDIPFKNNKFNKVFAFDVIEHLPKNTEVKFLSELIRTTKFSGEIIHILKFFKKCINIINFNCFSGSMFFHCPFICFFCYLRSLINRIIHIFYIFKN